MLIFVCEFIDLQAQQGDKLMEMFEALNTSILTELGKHFIRYYNTFVGIFSMVNQIENQPIFQFYSSILLAAFHELRL